MLTNGFLQRYHCNQLSEQIELQQKELKQKVRMASNINLAYDPLKKEELVALKLYFQKLFDDLKQKKVSAMDHESVSRKFATVGLVPGVQTFGGRLIYKVRIPEDRKVELRGEFVDHNDEIIESKTYQLSAGEYTIEYLRPARNERLRFQPGTQSVRFQPANQSGEGAQIFVGDSKPLDWTETLVLHSNANCFDPGFQGIEVLKPNHKPVVLVKDNYANGKTLAAVDMSISLIDMTDDETSDK